MRARALALALALSFPAAGLAAREKAKPEAPKSAAPKSAAPKSEASPPAPAYEGQILRLSEILGALAYLRDLCGVADGADYRGRAQSLIEAEREDMREKIAGAFNRGFRGYEASYAVCTDNARLVIERYQGEGAQIARDLGARYGG